MAVLTAPPLPAVAAGPRPLTWTVAQFHDVRATGVWDGRRTFLVGGAIWELGPMNPPHAAVVDHVSEVMRAVFGPGWRARAQLPLVLGADTDPLPDVAMVRGAAFDYLTKHPTTAELVVEVADTTVDFDLTTKAELYAAAGIADYWVVDLPGRRLVVLRDPAAVAAGGHAYRTARTLAPGDVVSPLAAPAAVVRAADLLP